jgi:hypothetical protein
MTAPTTAIFGLPASGVACPHPLGHHVGATRVGEAHVWPNSFGHHVAPPFHPFFRVIVDPADLTQMGNLR